MLINLFWDSREPSRIIVTDLAQSEHFVYIYNGNQDLNHLIILVNGIRIQEGDLEPNEQRTVDIARAMQPGHHNTVVAIARGRQWGEASLVIADS